MHLTSAKRLAPVCLLLLGSPALAQITTSSLRENSPYSRYGVGEQQSGTNIMLRGMGNVSTAFASPYIINTENPASYGSLRLTTYEVGLEASRRNIVTNDNSYGTGTANLSYLRIGIPLNKIGGLSFGVQPESRVYYRLQDSVSIPGLGRGYDTDTGIGGLNYAFIGLAGKVKGFSVGVNFGYLFGNVAHQSIRNFTEPDTAQTFNSNFSSFTKIGGIYYKLGAQYDAKINKKVIMRLGATATLSQDINAYRDEAWVAIRNAPVTYDTAYYAPAVRGNYTMPLSYSFGVLFQNPENWTISADYKMTQWSQFRNFGSVDSVADQSYRISVGGDYTPNPTNMYSYLQRVTYRLGFYYGQDYVRLRNTDLTTYAVTIGASLPFKRSLDRVHTALEVGSRGTTANGLIRENFVRFSLGISLNDRWFIKRKYD